MSEGAHCRLYLITPPHIDAAAFSSRLRVALEAGDVACFQLRLKDVDDDAIRRATDTLLPICQAHDVAFIMNDRPDLATELGCDGVHVGQDDTPYAEARRILGPKAIIGVTCQASRELAIAAAEAGADYVAFGAFFPTTTKEAKALADPEILAWWQTMTTVPCVAIGGITVANCATLAVAGADFCAVASGVWDYPAGEAQAVKDFNAVFARTHPADAAAYLSRSD